MRRRRFPACAKHWRRVTGAAPSNTRWPRPTCSTTIAPSSTESLHCSTRRAGGEPSFGGRWERDGGRELELFHREVSPYFRAAGRADEEFVDFVVTGDVRQLQFEQVVDITAGAVKFRDRGNRAHGRRKMLEPRL